MANQWKEPIKASKKLSVFLTSNVKPPWDAVWNNALVEFNKLSATHSLGVTFIKTTTPPETDSLGGADVQVDVLSGTTSFTVFGQTSSITLDGTAIEGHTQIVMQSFTGPQGALPPRVIKAFIFVPTTPTASATKSRIVGDPVKLVIAVHELVHACGLRNSDHSTGANADLFFSIPSLRDRVKPADDRLVVGNPSKELPPLFLNAATVGVIQATWK